MKKILIIFLIIAFTFYALQPQKVFGILDVALTTPQLLAIISQLIGVNTKLGTLTSYTTQLSNILEELKLMNSTLLASLGRDFEEKARQVYADYFKTKAYQENVENILKFVKLREDEAKDETKVEEAIEEAKIAGAYEAIQNFLRNTQCINPDIREEFENYALNLAGEYFLKDQTQLILEQIPDCGGESPITAYKPSSKLNLFTWLTEPFKLNLAQISEEEIESEMPNIEVTPAQRETESQIELNALKNDLGTAVVDNAKKYEENRKRQIGDVWPVEDCFNSIFGDEGKPICLKYQILLSGNDLKDLKKGLMTSNPTEQTTEDIDAIQTTREILYALNQDITGNPEVVEKIKIEKTEKEINEKFEKEVKYTIDKICQNYASYKATTDNRMLAYSECMKQMTEKSKEYVDSWLKEVDATEKTLKNMQDAFGETARTAEAIQGSLGNCSEALKDVIDIVQLARGKQQFYQQGSEEVAKIRKNIEKSLKKIDDALSKVQQTYNTILLASTTVIDILNKLFTIINNIAGWFDIVVPFTSQATNILTTIKTAIGEIDKNIVNNVLSLINQIRTTINLVSNTIIMTATLYYSLKKFNFSKADTLNDLQRLVRINRKLDTLVALTETQGASCLSPYFQRQLIDKCANDCYQSCYLGNTEATLKHIFNLCTKRNTAENCGKEYGNLVKNYYKEIKNCGTDSNCIARTKNYYFELCQSRCDEFCRGKYTTVASNLNKKQTVAFKNEKQKTNFNFLAFFEKLWKPKIVEIRNEK